MSYEQLNCDLKFQKAIRKAKADGMREAQTIVTDLGTGHADQTAAIIREIDREATRIEKGE